MIKFIIFFSFNLFAAPHPGTSSSVLISSQKGQFYSSLGFKINSGETDWYHVIPPKSSPFIETMYKAPSVSHGVQAALTVRIDKLKRPQSLKSYVNQWMSDYHRFGFDILNAKPVKVDNKVGFLVDLINRDSHRQLRQVVFKHDLLAVILTCRDHQDGFRETMKSCNQIIRKFNWTK